MFALTQAKSLQNSVEDADFDATNSTSQTFYRRNIWTEKQS